ncbi:MAG: hypothetical protein COA79_00275 [Planctomycetota bacterium]|nr:MAG: hypothetical protein COA79_00275 [Planctomycetota bacterium]
MIKTKFISTGDYFFSFKRGELLGNIKIIISACFKKVLFTFLSFLINLKCIKKKKFAEEKITSILIYFPRSSGMGDLIMAGHFFKLIRDQFKNAEIDLCSSTISFTNKNYFNNFIKHESGIFKEVKSLSARKYDLILFPEKSLFGVIVLLFLNINYFVGYISQYKLFHNMVNSDYPEFNVIKDHYYYKSLNLLRIFKKDFNYIPTEHLPIPIDNELKPACDNNKYCVIIPSVNWNNRTIDYSILKQYTDFILSKNSQIILLGSGESKSRIDKLLSDFKGSNLIYSPGKISIEELKSYIKNCQFVLCGDCGPMHIAYALKKPVYTFWGPTSPSLRIPPDKMSVEDFIFPKDQCKVSSCYNMEHKPFCKSCLRLSDFNDVNHFERFVEKVYG